MSEDSLITLAIFTFERAQIVKTILEGERIDVSLENLNQIQPVISAGVRVRIRQKDLPRALEIIEDLNLSTLYQGSSEEKEAPQPLYAHKRIILVPVDFSDYSWKACVWAVHFADKVDAEVFLLHSLYTPFYMSSHYFVDAATPPPYDMTAESLASMQDTATKNLHELEDKIRAEMDLQKLPRVEVSGKIVNGLPEEMVTDVAKAMKPMLIVMGSRGSTNRDYELIGSVTAEVIDTSKTPVLAVPQKSNLARLAEVRHVGFATSFAEKDMYYFDEFMELMGSYEMNIHLFNISTSKNKWDQIRLDGLKDYLLKKYPNIHIESHVLDEGDRMQSIEKFVREKEIKLVVLPLPRKSMWFRLFTPSLAQQILLSTTIPLLVFNTKE